jgi:hypothetical protein
MLPHGVCFHVPPFESLVVQLLPPIASFFSGLITQTKVCFPFSRCSFRYHASTSLLMCESKGRHLVISSSYHTNISFIISPLSYNTTYLSRLATSYSCTPFTMSMWSYHWQSRYPFAFSAPLGMNMQQPTTHFDIWLQNIVLENKTHVQRELSHLFPCHIWWQVDILITKDNFRILMDIIITNPTCIDMV